MKLVVKKQDIAVVRPERLVSGSVNLVHCEFEFDESWEGFGKTAVFASFGGVWAVGLVNNSAAIPWEALEAGRRLRIGVYGVKDDIRMPTVYTEPLFVETGAEEGDEPIEPSPDKWEQLMAAIEDGLLRGEDGHTPVKGVDYFTEEDVEALAAAAAERVPAGGGAAEAVLYVRQSLSDGQQAQARENIGALSEDELEASFDPIDSVIGLTEEEKDSFYDVFFEEMDRVIGGEI